MHINPRILKAYDKAEGIKARRRNEESERLAYMNGFYVLNALGASFGHESYPEKPVGLFDFHDPKDDVPLTEEQIVEKRNELVEWLKSMQNNFEENKKEQQEGDPS